MLFSSQRKAKDNVCKCDVCKTYVQQDPGYTKLSSNIRKHHPHVNNDQNKQAAEMIRKIFKSVVYPKKARSSHGWIESVAPTLQTLFFVTVTIARRHVKHGTRCHLTLLIYVSELMERVERQIKALSPMSLPLFLMGGAKASPVTLVLLPHFLQKG